MFTCLIRYEVDLNKLSEFRAYASAWIGPIEKYGGNHAPGSGTHSGSRVPALAGRNGCLVDSRRQLPKLGAVFLPTRSRSGSLRTWSRVSRSAPRSVARSRISKALTHARESPALARDCESCGRCATISVGRSASEGQSAIRRTRLTDEQSWRVRADGPGTGVSRHR